MPTPFAYPNYTIGAWAANVDDDYGCRWGVEPGIDITDGPGRKTHITSRPYVTGAYRSRSYIDSKSFTIPGWVQCPDRAGMIAARARLLALFPNGEQVPMVVDDGFSQRTITVELTDKPKVDPFPDGCGFDWQLSFLAADPRFLDATVLTSSTGTGGQATDGLDWATGGGLDWTGGGTGGLNWGNSGNTGSLVLQNTGNAEAWPLFSIAGQATSPFLTDVTTGKVIAFGDIVQTGQTLVIDTSPYTRSVELNSVDRFGSLTSAQWFPIPPNSTITVTYGAGGSGMVTASWQNASY
jgi:hypothetical protein